MFIRGKKGENSGRKRMSSHIGARYTMNEIKLPTISMNKLDQ